MRNYLKKNKGLFLLPLGLIPFLVLIFYVLGGGEGQEPTKQELNISNGVNYVLPEAEKSIEIFDKMEAYQRQGYEKEVIRSPFEEKDSMDTSAGFSKDSLSTEISVLEKQNDPIPDQLLEHIRQKELEVKKDLAGSNQKGIKQGDKSQKYSTYHPKAVKTESNPANYPESKSTGIEQLDKVFEENVALKKHTDSLRLYLAESNKKLAEIETQQKAGFSLEKTGSSGFNKNKESGLIKAEVYETTTVFDGNRIKLRLLEDTRIRKVKVPRNTFIYGICKVKNERLHIEISQMPVGNNFMPVSLAIHDLDGIPGLYVPDNVARKVSREVGAGTNTSSMLGVTGNPVTYAGIRAVDRTAQTLLKRVRLKKVTVKKNTLVYLINKK